MKKLIFGTLTFLLISAVGWATPCTGSLNSFLNPSAKMCTDASGNAFSSFTTSLSTSDSAKLGLSPLSSGSGFTLSIPLSLFAGTTTKDAFGFTVTAPAGVSLTDFEATFTPSAGATGTASVLLGLSNKSNLTADLGAGKASTTFSGVSSLDLVADITASADASGTATLTLMSSTTSTMPSAVPEPATLSLFGIGLLAAGLLLKQKKRAESSR